MKNVLLAAGLLSLMLVFNACQKDELADIDRQITEQTQHRHEQRSCGMDHHHEQLMQDPTYQREHQAKLEQVRSMVSFRSEDCNAPIVLPVAVHFQQIGNADEACLRQLALRQIAVLNADFQGNNADIDKWTNGAAASFPGIRQGEACFQFCLANRNHPAGSGLQDGEPAVTINATTGDSDQSWTGYINIFVRPNTGVLGYAPLGGEGNGDGIVVDAAAFGTGAGCGAVTPQAPYTLGRTLTHEMGHYLLLDHIWGDGCNTDDEVNDTPDSNEPYYDCPRIGARSCGSTDMHMNYMDYTNDDCMYMFTAGQISRSTNYVRASLQTVIDKGPNVCTPTDDGDGNGGDDDDNGGGGDTPSCDDGIQNGDETGVDCGGSQCLPCETDEEEEEEDNCPDFSIQLQLTLDNYGSEISWELYNGYYDLIANGGDYADDAEGTVVTEDFCLEDDCYLLVIYDDAYDGICCDYGEGSFQLLAEGEVFHQDAGDYGSWTEVEFCIESEWDRSTLNNYQHQAQPKDLDKVAEARARKQR